MARRKICDVYFTRTGFRYFECNPEKGFILNASTLKIKGVCAHEDCGLLGKAVPTNVHLYKIKLLKEMGANGYRTSHYQQNVAILDACDEAELILNGKSLGRKKVKKHTHLVWSVDYEAGKIEAIGYKDGKICATDAHETTGKPERLILRLENEIKSVNDVAIISCYTIDSEGRQVPDADPFVSFHANSLGRIISTGSDICDHTPLGSPNRKMRAGYIFVAVSVAQTRGTPVCEHGTIEAYAHSQGLCSAKIKIEI